MASELLANPLSPGLSRDPKVKSPWMLKLVERVVDEKLQQLMPKLEELLRQAGAAASSPLVAPTASPLPRSPASSLSKAGGWMVPPSPSSAEVQLFQLESGGLARMECQLDAVQREVHALRASFVRSSHEVDVLRCRMQEVDNMAIEWEGQMAEIQEEVHGFKMHAPKRLRQASETLSENCQAADGSEETEKLHCRLHDACATLIASQQQVEKPPVQAAEEDHMCQTVSFQPFHKSESDVTGVGGPVQQDLSSQVAFGCCDTAEEETKDSKHEASKNKWRRATAAALLQQAVRSPAARLQQKVRRSAAGKRTEPTSPAHAPAECQAPEVALVPVAVEEEDQKRAPAAEVVKKKSSLRVPPLNLTGGVEQKQERAVRRPFFTDELSIDIDSSTVTLFSCNTSCVTSPVNMTSAWSPFSESE